MGGNLKCTSPNCGNFPLQQGHYPKAEEFSGIS